MSEQNFLQELISSLWPHFISFLLLCDPLFSGFTPCQCSETALIKDTKNSLVVWFKRNFLDHMAASTLLSTLSFSTRVLSSNDATVAWFITNLSGCFSQSPPLAPFLISYLYMSVLISNYALFWHNCSSISGVTGHPFTDNSHIYTFNTFLSPNFYSHIYNCILNISIK